MSFVPILKSYQNQSDYLEIDLSQNTLMNNRVDVQNAVDLKAYIQNQLNSQSSKVAYGGYLEKRGLYNNVERFKANINQRDIHLGYDFWADAGEVIVSPMLGKIHSFSHNDDVGNYGPTIILEHQYGHQHFFSLYGHLSLKSIQNIEVGQKIQKGEAFAEIGKSSINGGYVPHLHFQLVKNLENYIGDYPGVCQHSNLAFYQENTICPKLYLGI